MASKATAATSADDRRAPPPPSVDRREEAAPNDTAGARSTAKRNSASSTTSATNASLVKDALKPNLSAVEATSQLKVLCRKFAALAEKVKEETRTREEAEKEVRRLRAIVEGNDAPVVASYRAETQAYIRELKDAQEALKQELRDEKAKNAMLVSKALELEKEKSTLLAAASQSRAQEMQCTSADQPSQLYASRRATGWDREQAAKIQETLRTTIEELQHELTRKEEELVSNRERLQRERARVKALEVDLHEREEASQEEHSVLKELESSIQEQRDQFEAIEKEMQVTQQRLEDEATMRSTLEQQIETLNEVNAALEQRAKALVRRLELGQSMVDEMEELKLQVRDVEVDKETLVRSIKDVKDQHFSKEMQWKAQLEQLRSEKLVLAAQISDLQGEITALRTQNSLFSEWMLVRSENIAVAQQQQQQQQYQQQIDDDHESELEPSQQRRSDRRDHEPHRPDHDNDHYRNLSRTRVRPLVSSESDETMYAHSSTRCPLSPSKTRSMTTASPIRHRSPTWLGGSRRTSMSSSASSSEDSEAASIQRGDRAPVAYRHAPRGEDALKSTARTAAAARVGTKPSSSTSSSKVKSKLSDHERLRELMSRNRELQTRLQQETLATRNLEQEISHIASQRGGASSSRMQST